MSEKSVKLKLEGIIDSGNSKAVKQELETRLAAEDPDAVSVIFDASQLTYISSAGLRVLLLLRKQYPDISIINVSPDIYEILETTGFTEMMTIEKAFRSISVDNCEVIGEGANGKVYRIDRETVVKTYKETVSLSEIRNEQNVSREALILGIPTAISYDVVRVGDGYGSMFELLDAQSFSKILAEHPEKTDWCVREFVKMLKLLHSTEVPEGKLPSINQTARGWVSRMKSCLPDRLGQKLQGMIDAVPERSTMIHGDYHTKNIVFSDGEVLLIDMDTLSTGHPIFELAQMFCAFVGFYEQAPQKTKDFHGFDMAVSRDFWRRSLKAYLETEDDSIVTREENKIRCVAYARLIDWSMRHCPTETEEVLAERAHWRRELEALLEKTDTLLREEEQRGEKADDGSLAVRLLNSGDFWRVDLHMHTTVSDGTDTPEELLDRVRKAGLRLFSITDHDSVKGCRIIREILREGDPQFVTGAEFSCKDDEGQYHILGYGFDPDSSSIQKLVETGHAYRIRKLRARLDFLEKEFGIEIPDEAVKDLYSMDNPGKPHIGNLMVKYGFAPTKEKAMMDYLNRFHSANEYLRPEEAVIGILAGGGIPVLAHPCFGSGSQLITGLALEERLRTLMSYGLKGVEAFYSGFTKVRCRETLSLAEKYGLYVTAGSDYHGENKNTVLGNTGMDSTTEVPEGFRRFLEDVNYLF